MSFGFRFPTQRFYQIQRLNPCWSSYICFVEALKDSPYVSRRVMRRSFEMLVDKDDYSRGIREQILKYLEMTFLKKHSSVA